MAFHSSSPEFLELQALDEPINHAFAAVRRKRRFGIAVSALGEIQARCSAKAQYDDPQPSLGDLLMMEDLQDLCLKVASNVDLCPERSLLVVEDRWPEIRRIWIEYCRAQLIGLLQKQHSNNTAKTATTLKKHDNVDPLQLSTSFFTCLQCPSHADRSQLQLRFPDILMHEYARNRLLAKSLWKSKTSLNESQRYLFDLPYESVGVAPWMVDHAIGLPEAHIVENVARMVELLHLDPKSATVEQLNELDPILECTDPTGCSDRIRGRCFMAWDSVVRQVPSITIYELTSM